MQTRIASLMKLKVLNLPNLCWWSLLYCACACTGNRHFLQNKNKFQEVFTFYKNLLSEFLTIQILLLAWLMDRFGNLLDLGRYIMWEKYCSLPLIMYQIFVMKQSVKFTLVKHTFKETLYALVLLNTFPLSTFMAASLM